MGCEANRHLWCGDARGRLEWQAELELVGEELVICVQLGITAENQGAAICGWEVYVEHLHGGELVEHSARGEAGGERLEPRPQGDVEAIGQEGDEDVGFDTRLDLVIDRAQLEIVLEVLERRLDLDKLDIEPPQAQRGPVRTNCCAADSDLRAGAPGAACLD